MCGRVKKHELQHSCKIIFKIFSESLNCINNCIIKDRDVPGRPVSLLTCGLPSPPWSVCCNLRSCWRTIKCYCCCCRHVPANTTEGYSTFSSYRDMYANHNSSYIFHFINSIHMIVSRIINTLQVNRFKDMICNSRSFQPPVLVSLCNQVHLLRCSSSFLYRL